MKNPASKTLIFALPYTLTALANIFFITIDQSISNSIGATALIVFSSFTTFNWGADTFGYGIANAHNIMLARNKKDRRDINATGIILQLFINLMIALLLLVFAEQITYVYTLSDEARAILTTILRMKAIQLPILSIGTIAENDLNVRKKVKSVFIIMVVSAIINILGDLVSVWTGTNEVGIYIATIISTVAQTTLLFLAARLKLGKIRGEYIKEMIKYSKDLIINKLVQRVANITYTSIASSLGTTIYAIYCACVVVEDTLDEMLDGFRTGLLVNFAQHISRNAKNLLQNVDRTAALVTFCFTILAGLVTFPMWWLLGRVVPWESCQPYIWLFGLDFVITALASVYIAYLSANKFTGPIRYMALVGGICVRLPLAFLFAKLGFGIYGLAAAMLADRTMRAIYIRSSIRRNRTRLHT